MAAKGKRGKGTVGPSAAQERARQDKINQAYFNIYGTYNIPSGPGPGTYAPSYGQLAGKDLSDLGTIFALQRMYG